MRIGQWLAISHSYPVLFLFGANAKEGFQGPLFFYPLFLYGQETFPVKFFPFLEDYATSPHYYTFYSYGSLSVCVGWQFG